MACTVDHLAPDQRVRILREFTDASGTRHGAGTRIHLHRISVDWTCREIRLEWDRDGARETVPIAIGASEGPRIGRMRDYFEVEPAVATAPAVATPAPPVLPDPPPASGPPLPRALPCGCDPTLHLPILVGPGDHAVHGCVRCGRVGVARQVGDDGRFTGDAWSAWIPEPVEPPVLRWLGEWPRVQVDWATGGRWPMAASLVRRNWIHLPRRLRCPDPDALREALDRAGPPRRGRAAARRLREMDPPRTPPPAGLPSVLWAFRQAAEALALRPDSPLPDLARLACPGGPASDLAVDLLWQRPDASRVMAGWLAGKDPQLQEAGFGMALEAPEDEAGLVGMILEILAGIPLDPAPDTPGRIAGCGRVEALLVLLLERRAATPEVLAALQAAALRFARRDPFLTRCCRIALAELRSGHPGNPPS